MQRRRDQAVGEPAPELLTVTRASYPHRPDRVTIHPTDVDDVTLMGTWLTADASDFVALDSVE